MSTPTTPTAIRADYQEKILVQPEDVIPKSAWFGCVKWTLVTSQIIMMIIAAIAIIVAESFLERSYLAVGVISLLGIILFLIGLIATMKEHVPSIMIFAVSMLFYLLILMYSRIFDTAGWIIIRTMVIVAIILLAIIYCILIRDWRQLQVSRLRQRVLKEAQLQQQQMATGYHGGPPPVHLVPPTPNHHRYEQIPENPYSQIPNTRIVTYGPAAPPYHNY